MSAFAGALPVDGALLLQLLGEVPSFNSYGCVPDGVTDNRAKIQNLINATSAKGGGVVRIPIGNYGIGDYLTIPANIWLVGSGPASILTRLGTLTAGKGLLTVTGDDVLAANFVLEGSTPTSAVVNDGSIVTPEDATLTANSSFWINPGVNKFQMRKVRVQHTGGYAVFDDVRTATSADHRFSDCEFINNRPHTFTDGTNVGGSWTGGIYVSGDCRSSAPYFLNGLRIKHCRWSRNTGIGFWSHSLDFTVHHMFFRVIDAWFEDQGLDAIEFGNVLGGGVTNSDFHRIGYLTSSDSAAPAPAYVPGHGACAIDTAGYASGITHSNNSILNPNGYGYNLDGMRDSSIIGGTIQISPSSDPQYAIDSVASMGILVSGVLTQVTKGIETGNSNQNGGAQRVTIHGVRIAGMGDNAMSLPFAKYCEVTDNPIDHPASAVGVPIELYGATGASPADEWMNHDNVVRRNRISYAGANHCIVEVGLCSNNDIADNPIPQ